MQRGELSSIQDLMTNCMRQNLPITSLSFYFSTTPYSQVNVCAVYQVSSQCNGDCFCLVSVELSRQCRCDARRIWKMKGAESDDLFNLPHTFLLLVSDSLILYLPIPDIGNDTTVRRLPFTPEGKIADMAYELVNRSVMWITANSKFFKGTMTTNSSTLIISPDSPDISGPPDVEKDGRGTFLQLHIVPPADAT